MQKRGMFDLLKMFVLFKVRICEKRKPLFSSLILIWYGAETSKKQAHSQAYNLNSRIVMRGKNH